MCMHTIFATLCQIGAHSPSLKLFVSAIIDDALTVSAVSRRANIGVMEKINNHIDPLKIQCACTPSWQIGRAHV